MTNVCVRLAASCVVEKSALLDKRITKLRRKLEAAAAREAMTVPATTTTTTTNHYPPSTLVTPPYAAQVPGVTSSGQGSSGGGLALREIRRGTADRLLVLLNTASHRELVRQVRGVGAKRAQAIIDHRHIFGPLLHVRARMIHRPPPHPRVSFADTPVVVV